MACYDGPKSFATNDVSHAVQTSGIYPTTLPSPYKWFGFFASLKQEYIQRQEIIKMPNDYVGSPIYPID